MIREKAAAQVPEGAGGQPPVSAPNRRAELENWMAVLLPTAKAVGRQLIFFAIGLLSARGVVFGKYAPFGVAAVAAAPYHSMWSTVLGCAIGYLLPSSVGIPIHYLAAILAAAAIRWTMNDLVRIRQHPVFAPLTAFLPTFCTGMALAVVNGSTSMATAMYLAESLLAGGAAYFMSHAVSALGSRRGISGLSGQEVACALLSMGVLLLALSDLTLGGISAGHIIAVVGILFAAKYGGVAGGGISGIAVGTLFSLSTSGLNYLSGAYALGGLMAGVFSPVGRLASAVAFVIANGVASLQVGNQAAVVNGLYEVMAASILFMILPKDAGNRLVGMLSSGDDRPRTDGLRRSVIMKLDYAAKALSGVSESVEEVSRKLCATCAPDINGVYKRAIDETCMGCGLKVYCWERNYSDSMNAFNDLTLKLRKRSRVDRTDFCPQFATHCSRLGEIVDSVNKNYAEFSMREAVEGRLAQVRGMVATQFTTTSRMLEDMAGEMELFERFDFAAAQRVAEVLRTAGVTPIEVSCRVDQFNRMSIEVEAMQVERLRMNRGALMKEISRACGKLFETPCISTAQGKCRMQMSERPIYRVQTGCAQHVCGNGQLCGDSYSLFNDGCGRQVAIISDGMGSGGRAAVDGAMASGILSQLIKAGIGFDTSLKIVNSALVVKSGDESLATVDMAVLDLFSGSLEVRKAGAPITILRKNGQARRVDAPSLPVGILNETRFAKANEILEEGDLLVMMSDGALAAGDEWVCESVEQWQGQDAQDLADELVASAVARRSDGHDDDITVVVMRMTVPKQIPKKEEDDEPEEVA
ncbi:SpoIIE family protein phosphatase [Anaeromassilibacillus senegalensis]|uniref:SpoIIE family protein phosphatase n=1 Tax=Anaeromassilibacillus senegalensis TaxID=1673717 RepID=UPI0009E2811B|nr:SpoIIE family protein phosphatase [Anaeromassilibacillus senegalensis]